MLIFLHRDCRSDQQHLLKMDSFFHCVFLAFFVRDKVCDFYFWIFYSIPLITLTASVQMPCNLHPSCSVVLLEVRDADSSSSSFIVKNCFGFSASFQMNQRIALPMSMKKCVGIFMGIALTLQNVFIRTAIFAMLTLPIHEHGRSHHFRSSSLINFLRDMKLFSQRSFSHLV